MCTSIIDQPSAQSLSLTSQQIRGPPTRPVLQSATAQQKGTNIILTILMIKRVQENSDSAQLWRN